MHDLCVYFLRLGTVGFGGPVALIGAMHRDLVEQKKWISEEEYKDGLALAQLAPGPLAAQTSMYLGYVHYGAWGAALTGLCFVIPSFLMVLALGWAYLRYQGLPWMWAAFYGVGAAVIGMIAFSSQKLARKTLGGDKLLWSLFLAGLVVTAVTESEWVILFLASGLLAWWIKVPPRWLRGRSLPLLALPLAAGMPVIPESHADLLLKILIFFAKAGAFVFGSGLAIVPFLHGGVVQEYHWLNERQFLDAVAVAMITPGPVVITVGFIGYLVAGLPGACVAAVGTFVPCYFFTVVPAPFVKRYGKQPAVAAFVDGVTAAAIGTIAGAVIVLGRRSVVDWQTGSLALLVFGVLWKGYKVPEPLIILAAALGGLVLKYR